MAVPNIFGTATAAIPLSQLDTNFATAITLGNTAVYLGNTTTSLGNVTLTNVTISSGNVTVTGANISGTANVSTLVVTGNQTSLGNVTVTGNVSANIVTVAAGAVGTPSITTAGDTNTGIFFPAADTIAFAEGGAEVARFDSSGNFGIGSTPTAIGAYKVLEVNGTSGAYIALKQGGTEYGNIYNNSTDGTSISASGARNVIFQTNAAERMRINSSGNVGIGTSSPSGKLHVSGGSNPQIVFDDAASRTYGIGVTSGVMSFYDVTGAAELMRIDSGGNLLVGTTTNYGTARTSINNSGAVLGLYCSGASGTTGMVIGKQSNDASTSQVLMQFLYNNGSSGLGQINGNGGSSAAFGSYSDIRLKENITDLPSQLANIMALRPVEFDWKDGTGHQIGFIAQEVNEVYPDVVGENADGMLTLTDMNKNDARLIKAVQEMKAIIDTQASTITALTARITALEQA
jgi:hypothetical protein